MLGVIDGEIPAPSPGCSAMAEPRLSPPPQWADDLSPISASDWSFDRAAHLLERAGFGGTPNDIARLAAMSPQAAVSSLVDYRASDNHHHAPLERLDVWHPSLRDFPLSRVAATAR